MDLVVAAVDQDDFVVAAGRHRKPRRRDAGRHRSQRRVRITIPHRDRIDRYGLLIFRIVAQQDFCACMRDARGLFRRGECNGQLRAVRPSLFRLHFEFEIPLAHPSSGKCLVGERPRLRRFHDSLRLLSHFQDLRSKYQRVETIAVLRQRLTACHRRRKNGYRFIVAWVDKHIDPVPPLEDQAGGHLCADAALRCTDRVELEFDLRRSG